MFSMLIIVQNGRLNHLIQIVPLNLLVRMSVRNFNLALQYSFLKFLPIQTQNMLLLIIFCHVNCNHLALQGYIMRLSRFFYYNFYQYNLLKKKFQIENGFSPHLSLSRPYLSKFICKQGHSCKFNSGTDKSFFCDLSDAVYKPHNPEQYQCYNQINHYSFRGRVFFGFIVSLLVQNILPWKYINLDNFTDFSTRINCFYYHIIFAFLTCFLSITLLSLFLQYGTQKIRKDQVHEWMIGFQNFLYPILVLSKQPLYFFVLVLCSKLVETIIFIKTSKEIIMIKVLQMGIFISQLVYHLIFFVFYLGEDNTLITYSSIICLGFFLFGALLNFLMVIFIVLSAVINLWKKQKYLISNSHTPKVSLTRKAESAKYTLEKKVCKIQYKIQFKQDNLEQSAVQSISRVASRQQLWRLKSWKNSNNIEIKSEEQHPHPHQRRNIKIDRKFNTNRIYIQSTAPFKIMQQRK